MKHALWAALAMYWLVWTIFWVLALASPSAAQSGPCGLWEDIEARLTARYGERVVALGVRTGGGLLAILTDPAGTTWTAVLIDPNGRACLVDEGANWADYTPPPEPPGEDS